ncbi:MAG: hypothetical protein WDN02_07410 [Methylovirgula sp.]|uniref:hypothetical protein n=1 Tax=Methylovirgula sp. TaxID=1978224 RepID=UPI0030765013
MAIEAEVLFHASNARLKFGDDIAVADDYSTTARRNPMIWSERSLRSSLKSAATLTSPELRSERKSAMSFFVAIGSIRSRMSRKR